MPSNTPNYNLTTYDAVADTGEVFINFRNEVAGTVDSNMHKIDTQMKQNADDIQGLVVGALPDGSIEDIKLSNTAGQIKDKVSTNTNNITDIQNFNNKLLQATVTGSNGDVTATGITFTDGDKLEVEFDTAITSPATISFNAGTQYALKDLEGNNINIEIDTIYVVIFKDDVTDFFAVAPRGGGISGVDYENYTLLTNYSVNKDDFVNTRMGAVAGITVIPPYVSEDVNKNEVITTEYLDVNYAEGSIAYIKDGYAIAGGASSSSQLNRYFYLLTFNEALRTISFTQIYDVGTNDSDSPRVVHLNESYSMIAYIRSNSQLWGALVDHSDVGNIAVSAPVLLGSGYASNDLIELVQYKNEYKVLLGITDGGSLYDLFFLDLSLLDGTITTLDSQIGLSLFDANQSYTHKINYVGNEHFASIYRGTTYRSGWYVTITGGNTISVSGNSQFVNLTNSSFQMKPIAYEDDKIIHGFDLLEINTGTTSIDELYDSNLTPPSLGTFNKIQDRVYYSDSNLKTYFVNDNDEFTLIKDGVEDINGNRESQRYLLLPIIKRSSQFFLAIRFTDSNGHQVTEIHDMKNAIALETKSSGTVKVKVI